VAFVALTNKAFQLLTNNFFIAIEVKLLNLNIGVKMSLEMDESLACQ